MNGNFRKRVSLFAAGLTAKSRSALTVLAVFLGSSSLAQATVMDSIGNYL